jgi:hypothetical protein
VNAVRARVSSIRTRPVLSITAAADSNGKTHIVYEDDNDTLWYTNNVGGDFAPPHFPFAAFDAGGC